MPTLSRFSGILIRMYYADHAPPHFHALYGGQEVVIGISPIKVLFTAIFPTGHCRWFLNGQPCIRKN